MQALCLPDPRGVIRSSSRCNATVVMDDYCKPDSCHAHDATGHNSAAAIGPTLAWTEAIATGHIRHVHAWLDEASGGASDRGWVHGVHICDEVTAMPKPVRAKYSWDPVHIRYKPDVRNPSGERSMVTQRSAAQKLWK